MPSMGTLCIFLIVFETIFVLSSGCPRECSCHNHEVRCRNKNFVTIPSNIPSTTEVLDLSGNDLGQLDNLPLLLNLETLYLNNSRIISLDSSIFSNFTSLKHLDLSDNQLTYLKENVFNNLQLHSLNLNRNEQLTDSSLNTFNNSRITNLYLNNASFSLFLLSEFFTSLRVLHISNNKKSLSMIKREELDHLNLDSILMENSGLKSIFFLRESKVRELNVNGNPSLNKTGDVWDIIASIEGLETLELRATGISSITLTSSTFELVNCMLSHNRIQTLEVDTFRHQTLLETLDLSHNLIDTISPGVFKANESKLIILDLSSNHISYINIDMFEGLDNLELLDISDNAISSFSPSIKPLFNMLRILRLYDIHLNCSCDMLWFRQWVSVVIQQKTIEGAKCDDRDIIEVGVHEFDCVIPRISSVDVDNNVIQCVAVGKPKPNLEFTNFTLDQTTQVEQSGTQSSAIEVYIICLEVGTYWCHAKNILGESESSLKITADHTSACKPHTTTKYMDTSLPLETTIQPYPTTDALVTSIDAKTEVLTSTESPVTVVTPPQSSSEPTYITTQSNAVPGDFTLPAPVETTLAGVVTTLETYSSTQDIPNVHNTTDIKAIDQTQQRADVKINQLKNGEIVAIIISVMILCILFILGAIYLVSRFIQNKRAYDINDINGGVSTITGNGHSNGNSHALKENGYPPKQTYINYTLEDVQC